MTVHLGDGRPWASLFDLPELSGIFAPLPPDRLVARWHPSAVKASSIDGVRDIVTTVARLLTAVQETAGFAVSAVPTVYCPAVQQAKDAAIQFELYVPTMLPSALAQILPEIERLQNAWLRENAGGEAVALLLTQVERLARLAPPGLNSRMLLDAAYRLGLPVLPLGGQTFQLGWGARSRWIDSTFTDKTSGTSARLARDKRLANRLLRENGLPVARQFNVPTLNAALEAAQKIGFPLVLKPADLDGGIGVFAGIRNENELRRAFGQAQQKSRNLIVEEQLAGNDYRLGITHGELTWATYREPAGVHGDGLASVSELVDRRNLDVRRGIRQWSPMRPILIDDEARSLLAQQRMALDDIPAKGQFIRLRNAANIMGGGYPTDVAPSVHPDNVALAIRAARVFRLDIAGIDFIMPDITKSWREVGGGICEINGQPQYSVSRLDAPFATVAGLFDGDGRVPIITLLGSVDEAWLCELERALATRGICAGICSPASFSIGGGPVAKDRISSFDETQQLLRDPGVDAVVVVVQDEEWLASGMPFDHLDLLIAAPDAKPHFRQMLTDAAKAGAHPMDVVMARSDKGIDWLADEVIALRDWHDANDLPLARIASAAVAASPYGCAEPPVPGSIGLCMIVKNEAHVIRRSLDSVRHLVDYVLVEDTGSADGTQQIVRDWLRENSIDGDVIESPWRDFAWNRTQALAHLRAAQHIDYAFILDADDVVEMDEGLDIAAFKARLTADIYDVSIRQGPYRFMRPHLCRNAKAFGYRSVLHEYLEVPDDSLGRGHLSEIAIKVLNEGDRSRNPRKYADDAALLERALLSERDPHLRSRYTFYLAQSYSDAGQPEKALKHYMARAAMGHWVDEVYVSLYRSAKLSEQLRHPFEEVERAFLAAISVLPSRAEAYHGASRHYRLSKRFEQGYMIAQTGLAKARQGRLFVEQWVCDYGLLDEFAVNAFWSGRYAQCIEACEKILALPGLPEKFAERVVKNLDLSRARLAGASS